MGSFFITRLDGYNLMDCKAMSSEIVYLDLETTGLDPSDEIIEIGILSDDDTVLLNTRIKPVHNVVWPEAQQINGISPDDVKDAPLLDEVLPQIIKCIKDKIVVIYNADFDLQFLKTELEQAKDIECCMLKFAPVYGEWHDYWENYTWQKLTTAARYVLFKWGKSDPHSAIADCRATRAVWHYLTDSVERKRIDAIKQQEREKQEIEDEVKYYLRKIERDENHRQETFLEEMNSFWTKRILGKELLMKCSIWNNTISMTLVEQGNEQQKIEELDEVYHVLFTGFPKKIWEKLCWYENSDLQVYRQKKDIPTNLVVFSKLVATDWILKEMRAVAYFLSLSGKTFSLLYNISDIEKIRKTRPNRYESWESVPNNLKSKTRTKREHGVDVEKEGMKPVGDVRMYTPYGIEYIPLYSVSNIPKKVSRKKKAIRVLDKVA